jgi:cell fate (sporulation/competence/biofilm development) regulator YmcA (YheA/YmcA/DUF963 family)
MDADENGYVSMREFFLYSNLSVEGMPEDPKIDPKKAAEIEARRKAAALKVIEEKIKKAEDQFAEMDVEQDYWISEEEAEFFLKQHYGDLDKDKLAKIWK